MIDVQSLFDGEVSNYYESKRYKHVEFDIEECMVYQLRPLFTIFNTAQISINGVVHGYVTIVAKNVKF